VESVIFTALKRFKETVVCVRWKALHSADSVGRQWGASCRVVSTGWLLMVMFLGCVCRSLSVGLCGASFCYWWLTTLKSPVSITAAKIVAAHHPFLQTLCTHGVVHWAAMKTGLTGCVLSYQPLIPWSPQKNTQPFVNNGRLVSCCTYKK